MAKLTGLLFRGSLVCVRLMRLFDAAAAGTLTRAELRAGIERDWEELNQLPEDVFSGLLAWERLVFDRTLWDDDRILVVGCGTGRELIALAEQGYEVVGIEPSRPAIALARKRLAERHLTVPIVQGFLENVTLPGTFDAIIFSHGCYGLIQGATDRIAALRKCRMALNPDGRILASYAPGRGMQPILLRLARLTAAITRSGVQPEPGDDFYRITTTSPYFGYEHYFRPGEFESEAARAGLQVELAPERGCPLAVLTPQTRVRRTAMRLEPALQEISAALGAEAFAAMTAPAAPRDVRQAHLRATR